MTERRQRMWPRNTALGALAVGLWFVQGCREPRRSVDGRWLRAAQCVAPETCSVAVSDECRSFDFGVVPEGDLILCAGTPESWQILRLPSDLGSTTALYRAPASPSPPDASFWTAVETAPEGTLVVVARNRGSDTSAQCHVTCLLLSHGSGSPVIVFDKTAVGNGDSVRLVRSMDNRLPLICIRSQTGELPSADARAVGTDMYVFSKRTASYEHVGTYLFPADVLPLAHVWNGTSDKIWCMRRSSIEARTDEEPDLTHAKGGRQRVEFGAAPLSDPTAITWDRTVRDLTGIAGHLPWWRLLPGRVEPVVGAMGWSPMQACLATTMDSAAHDWQAQHLGREALSVGGTVYSSVTFVSLDTRATDTAFLLVAESVPHRTVIDVYNCGKGPLESIASLDYDAALYDPTVRRAATGGFYVAYLMTPHGPNRQLTGDVAELRPECRLKLELWQSP